jgi:hypothetical protein
MSKYGYQETVALEELVRMSDIDFVQFMVYTLRLRVGEHLRGDIAEVARRRTVQRKVWQKLAPYSLAGLELSGP